MFENYMASFRPEQEICPCCQAKGHCRIHAYYSRGIVDFIRGVPTMTKIHVLRVICKGCGHTHAILPDCIIPYVRHSLTFFLQVLNCCFRRRMTMEAICGRFGLEMSTLRQWITLYRDHKALYLGSLRNKQFTEDTFLRRLCRLPKISSFLTGFCSITGYSFLQRHRNPAANTDRCEIR